MSPDHEWKDDAEWRAYFAARREHAVLLRREGVIWRLIAERLGVCKERARELAAAGSKTATVADLASGGEPLP
jgi:hypothetical protein